MHFGTTESRIYVWQNSSPLSSYSYTTYVRFGLLVFPYVFLLDFKQIEVVFSSPHSPMRWMDKHIPLAQR